MATRADEPLIVREGGLEGDDAKKAEALRFDIADTRDQMGRTVSAIEERLSPKHLKEQVTSVKEHVVGELKDAKDRVLGEMKDAKKQIQGEVSDGLATAKHKVREATVGRVETMVHDARETVTEAGSSAIDTIKTNPIPAVMIAVGLGWLVMSGLKGGSREDHRIRARSRDQWYGYREGGPYQAMDEGIDEDGYRYAYYRQPSGEAGGLRGPRRVIAKGERAIGNAADRVKSSATGVAERVRTGATDAAQGAQQAMRGAEEKVSQVAHEVGDRVSHVARDAQMTTRRVVRRAGYQARRAEQTIGRQLHENPLAFGALAVAVGAAVGLLLPHTAAEDRMIGSAKDKLLDQAKSKVQGAAQQALSTVEEKVATVAGGIGKTGGETDKGEQKDDKPFQNGLSNGLSHKHA